MFGTLARLGEFSQPFKQAQFGLFGGKTKQYGNNVPFSKHKTRRSWLPNVQRKRLPSEAVGEKLRVKVTTRALRTIKKYGGVDQYLTKTPAHKLSHEGMNLRVRVKDALKRKEAQHRASPAGKAEIDEQCRRLSPWELQHGRLHIKAKRLANLIEEPTLEAARQARLQVAKSLGLKKQLPSALQTFQYLTQQRAVAA